jgi:enediyne biosynthesis protein E4
LEVLKQPQLIIRVAFALACLSFFSCEKEEKEPALFELVPPEKSGVTFENKLTSTDSLNILEYLYFYNGGGVAIGDINSDGLPDLYFSGNQVSNKLYLNKGNFQFEDITDKAGVTGDGGWSTGVTMADVNGDGLLDIYVCQVGDYKQISGRNKLYINQGDETFIDLAEAYGVDFKGFSTQAAFFDYDRDGDLDLYLLNHSVKSPEVFARAINRNNPDEEGDRLFKNLAIEGERGLVDVTEAAGIYSSILGFGLGIGVDDVNDDGWPDLYVSNDFTENDYLYLNQKDGTFKESLDSLISNTSRYSMGNDLGDLNGDGLPEIFTTDMLPEDPEIWMKSVGEDKAEVYQIKKQFGYADQYVRNHLQLNRGEKGFSEIALYADVFASDWSWSPLIFDMDNDGRKDIHVTNGIVKRPNDLDFIQYSQEVDPNTKMEDLRKNQIDLLPTVKLPNHAFRQGVDLQFSNESKAWGLDQPSYSNGSAYADLDNDGDLDLVINNLDQPAFIYQNHSGKNGNTSLSIDLKASLLNPFGIGSKVSVFSGENSWHQYVSGTRGFQSGSTSTLVFGLGEINKVDSVSVRWPDGNLESFSGLILGQKNLLIQGTGNPISAKILPYSTAPDFPMIDWKHTEYNEIDETKREYLIPKSFATAGPALAIGDVNGDGLADVYLGGAKGQAGEIFLQTEAGEFISNPSPIFQMLAKAEDVVAAFADFNRDGNLDLYIGSGGNEYDAGNLFNFDRIYFGDGKGGFSFIPNALPPIGENTSTIAVHDFDQDGDLDIFVGASIVSGNYGASPKSSLLINQGNGQFKDETLARFGQNIDFGMVNSALWTNLSGDDQLELVLTGDWQGIRVFELGAENTFQEKVILGLEKSAGWIASLQAADVNGDGRIDLLTGNLGLNSKLKASVEKPVWLYHADFDGNGQADPLIFHYMGEKLVPFGTRDDLIKQIPILKRKHSSYADYSKSNQPADLFSVDILAKAARKAAVEFRSGAYIQQADDSFLFSPFPFSGQLSTVQDLAWDESSKRIFVVGNFNDFRVDLGKSTANSFQTFQYKDGIWVTSKVENSIPNQAEIRHLKPIKVKGTNYQIAVPNNGRVFWVKLD